MKKMFFLLMFAILSSTTLAFACVGKTLHVGISASNEKLMAEMASLIITERTGSSVKIEVYKDSKSLYEAIKQGKVNIIIENTDRALEVLGKTKGSLSGVDAIKSEYRKNFNLTWLNSFGVPPLLYAPVLTADTLANYPALPKLLNKLAGVLANDVYAKLLKTVESEDKTKKVAKDFLKGKKLI